MKHITVLAALLLSFSSQAGELRLVLHGDGLAGQTLMVALFDSPKDFLAERRVRAVKTAASGDVTTLLIPDLKPGRYAISAFVDSNQNGKLDTNLIGKPKELYGFSNDARAFFGAPGFAESSFAIGDGTAFQIIHLQ